MSSKQGNFKNQVCVLRVNIHCDGCKKKVKKLLQKIEGVDATMIDAELGKVTVSGYVHPNTLINKLVKSGKHAELWAAQKNKPFAAQNQLMNQFTDLRFEDLGKPRKAGKGFSKDLNTKSGTKHPKSVKFDLRDDEEFLGSDGGFSQSDGEGDGFELDFGRRAPSRTPARGGIASGNGQHGPKQKKNGPNGPGKNGKSGGVRPKKGGIFGIRLLFFKGFGRKKKCKNASAGKKGGGNGAAKGSCMKQGTIEFKSGGKNGGWVLENGKSGGKGTAPAAPKNGGKDFRGGNNQGNGGKSGGRGGEKNADFQEIDSSNHRRGGGGSGGGGYGGGDGFAGRVGPMGSYPVGQMGSNLMGPMGNYPMGQMGNNSVSPMGPMGPMVNNFVGPMGQYPAGGQMGAGPARQMGNYQAVHGLPAATPMSGGYYPPGMGPMNHHQYMGMMMNQPHPLPNGVFHPAMYGRPHPMTGFAPHRPSDGYTNMFNDENTESCSIM